MPDFRPFPPYVLLRMGGKPKFDLSHSHNCTILRKIETVIRIKSVLKMATIRQPAKFSPFRSSIFSKMHGKHKFNQYQWVKITPTWGKWTDCDFNQLWRPPGYISMRNFRSFVPCFLYISRNLVAILGYIAPRNETDRETVRQTDRQKDKTSSVHRAFGCSLKHYDCNTMSRSGFL